MSKNLFMIYMSLTVAQKLAFLDALLADNAFSDQHDHINALRDELLTD